MRVSYIYIQEGADKIYYTGVTSNLEKRIVEHHSGAHPDSYTAKRPPLKLLFFPNLQTLIMLFYETNKLRNGLKLKRKL
ncbi:putative endonuclease [Salegentibacter salinarum]|uniref:GIY-YIG nuclease family protein n=1 Tax=Salegentibacter salinarum TaxID=447422 RepID=UPI0009C76F4B|nr:GIY-YIG nuclease family protein [Salegentibacter salinarum]SKB44691.1 putative endonuclease [Salegentibacter salinarum]